MPKNPGLEEGVTPKSFHEGVYKANEILSNWSFNETNIHYWVHVGFWDEPIQGHTYLTWSNDGVHPNAPYGRLLYKT